MPPKISRIVGSCSVKMKSLPSAPGSPRVPRCPRGPREGVEEAFSLSPTLFKIRARRTSSFILSYCFEVRKSIAAFSNAEGLGSAGLLSAGAGAVFGAVFCLMSALMTSSRRSTGVKLFVAM